MPTGGGDSYFAGPKWWRARRNRTFNPRFLVRLAASGPDNVQATVLHSSAHSTKPSEKSTEGRTEGRTASSLEKIREQNQYLLAERVGFEPTMRKTRFWPLQ